MSPTPPQLFMELLDKFPNKLVDATSYTLYDKLGDKKQYTLDNCKKYNMEFLPNFIDVDTYHHDGIMRVQGVHKVSIDDMYTYTVAQFAQLLTFIEYGMCRFGKDYYTDELYLIVSSFKAESNN